MKLLTVQRGLHEAEKGLLDAIDACDHPIRQHALGNILGYVRALQQQINRAIEQAQKEDIQ